MAVSKQAYDLSPMAAELDAPPSYEQTQRDTPTTSTSIIPSPSSPNLQLQCVQSTFKPIVIPQTSKSFRGAFFSPFSRVYSPTLEAQGISMHDFLFFVDGLNEAFISNPAFQITTHIGNIMTLVPFHPVMWAGMGLATASGLVSAATSWTRARAYVRAANEEIFLPKGLRCRVLKTQKMMAAVGQEGTVLQLPPLDILDQRDGQIGGKEDPRTRRMRAMGDMVAPLTFEELPAPETFENWWKRMGSKQAQRQDAKMQKKLMKERRKGFEDYEDEMGKVGEETRKGDKEIAKVERERTKEIAKAERKLNKKAGDPEKKAKIEEDLQHELRKLDKDMNKALREKEKEVGKKTRKGNKKAQKADRKENKIAQKIYWIVINKEDRLGREDGVEDDVEVDTEDEENGPEPTKAS